MEHLELCIRNLESIPEMRKGMLIERVLRDTSIDWDAVFCFLKLRRRHRHRMRWKKAVITWILDPSPRIHVVPIQDYIHRPFPRGGARNARPPVIPQPLNVAPWYVDVRELMPFEPTEVWDRFRLVFPVLTVYRSGWTQAYQIAAVPHLLTALEWNAQTGL